jgi:hypothetical protein
MAELSNSLLLFFSIFFSKSLKRNARKSLSTASRQKLNANTPFGRFSGGPTTPIGKPIGLGSSAFARRYLRNLFDFFSSG